MKSTLKTRLIATLLLVCTLGFMLAAGLSSCNTAQKTAFWVWAKTTSLSLAEDGLALAQKRLAREQEKYVAAILDGDSSTKVLALAAAVTAAQAAVEQAEIQLKLAREKNAAAPAVELVTIPAVYLPPNPANNTTSSK